MDVTPYASAIVTALIAGGATYAAMSSRLAVLESKMDSLTESVRKHNNLVERMAVAEREQKTLWKAMDELKESVDRLDATIGHAPTK